MSTKLGPNLEFAEKTFIRFLDDTCTITRDAGSPNDSEDDILDPVTGELVPPVGGTKIIYSGKFKCSPILTSEPRFAVEGEGKEGKRGYTGSILKSAPVILVGDYVKVTSSRRDPKLVGKVFRVRESVVNSWAIQRKLILELREVL